MAIVVLVSGLVGVALALLAEYLDWGFRSGVQFEHHTGVPVLAMIPLVPKEKGATADHMLDRPISAYAEAIRSVYASLLLGSTETPLRTIVVASSNPREGKSTLALSLCRMMALNGHRVVLVETDLRHPSIHDLLGIPRRIGLAEVLLGKAQLEDGLFRDPRSSADVLLTGLETINPSTLLASHQMGALLDQLAQRYDRVIIDTAPVLVVSDGWLLSNKADATIFTCQWAATSRETARLGLKELRMAKANIIGAVLSAVDTKKIMSYGYADAVNYYSKSRYYVE
jgi:capsular exopolysaccharide synthesis family protein